MPATGAQRFARLVDLMLCRVVLCLGQEAALVQLVLAREVRLGKGDVFLCSGDGRARKVCVAAQRGPAGLRLRNGGVGLGNLDPIRLLVDAEQQLALGHLVAVTHQHLDDLTGDFGRDRHAILLDVGVVRRHLALQARPVGERTGDQQQRHQRHQRNAAPAPLFGCRRRSLIAGGSIGCDFGIGLSHGGVLGIWGRQRDCR